MHPYAPMYIGSICPMQYAGNLVAQTELARQRMRGYLQLGRVARAHLTWLFEQHSRQGSSLEIAFVLACSNLTMPHRSCAAVLRAFSLMPAVHMRCRVWVACIDCRVLSVELPYLA